MRKTGIITVIFAIIMVSCNNDKSKTEVENPEFNKNEQKKDTLTKHLKPFNPELPTIGLLMYNGVLQSEVIATSDVFAKPTEDGKQLFNVISIAETESPITTGEGMHFVPDYTFDNCPKLTKLFVPSTYDSTHKSTTKKS